MTEALQPPIMTNADGAQRRVGFELEYTGIDLPQTAALLQRLFGGTVTNEHNSSYALEGTAFGKFTVMLDAQMIQKLSSDVAKERATDPHNESLKGMAERLLGPLVAGWVPNEIVTPPIPLDQLHLLDEMTKILRENGAEGTGASAVYAFGMHINAELPGVPLERLKDYIAAFVLLQERLQLKGAMDLTRQLSRYAKLFPEDYVEFILQPDYEPDFETLVRDYLRFNPTRNRALDMLPAFTHLVPEIVAEILNDGLTQARPTFHYRLPNSSVDEPGWSMIDEWNLWIEVETLAEDKERLRQMAAAYLA